MMFDNESNTLKYVIWYDSASQPVSTDTPKFIVSCNHNIGSVDIKLSSPLTFGSGCWVVCSANRDAITAGYGTVVAGDVTATFLYR